MVITGPLLVETIVKPSPLENEVKNAFQKLKDVVTPKYHFSQGNQSPTNDISKSIEIPLDKSWKHADFFMPTQQNFMFDGDVSVYPFGNVIPNQPTMHEGKYANKSQSMFYKKTYPSGAFENPIPETVDLDLLSLLSIPLNKEENLPNNVIPDQPLEFMYDNMLQPSGPSSIDSTIFNEVSEIWDSAHQKHGPVGEFQEQYSSNPFVNDLSALEPRLSPAESYESLFPDVGNQSSPSTVPSSPVQSKASPWSDELQEMFEKTFDFSDIDMDLILPPPPKRLHENKNNTSDTNPTRSLIPITVSNHALQAATEPLIMANKHLPNNSELSKDHLVVSKVKSEPVDHKPVLPVGIYENSKAKSTTLFGKHEDEIIHKLLVPSFGPSKKPVTRIKLVSMPVEEFNHLLELTELNDIEVAFMKEWRRRGKNKTAAQIARKRKREQVGDLETEVEEMRQQKVELQTRCDHLRLKIASLKERSLVAEKDVYKQYSQSYKQSSSRDTHLIHISNDNKIMLIPRVNPQIIAVK